jgi:hypothetical protein
MGRVLESDSEFDRWFAGELRAVHGIDPSLPPPSVEKVELF